MASSIKTIYDKLVTEFGTMSTVDHVFQSGVANPDGFPYITIEWGGNEGEARDEVHNLITYKYRVRVYQEGSSDQVGQQQAEVVVMQVADEINNLLNNNYTLDGLVDTIRVVRAEPGYAESAEGVARIGEFLLEIVKLEDNFTT